MTVKILLVLASAMVMLIPVPSLVQANRAPRHGTPSTHAPQALLNVQLKQAVDAQNWRRAIQIVDQMIANAPRQATQLRSYRAELQKLLKAGVRVPSNLSGKLGPVRVQIKRRDGGVAVIDVLFNRQQRFEMAVDSGASVTVITRPMAAALGLTTADVIDRAVFITANGKTVMPMVYVDAIEVGGLSASRVPVAIAGSGMTIGLLGQDFLQKYDVSFKGNIIEFHAHTQQVKP